MTVPKFIHQKFGLSDEECVDVFLFLADCVIQELEEDQVLKLAEEKLNEKQRLFASFMMGFFSGLHTCSKHLAKYGIPIPPEVHAEREFFSEIVREKMTTTNVEYLRSTFLAKIRSVKERKFRDSSYTI
jgi:hypothetical protein